MPDIMSFQRKQESHHQKMDQVASSFNLSSKNRSQYRYLATMVHGFIGIFFSLLISRGLCVAVRNCQDKGVSKVICQDACDLATNTCWQKTEIQSCSCKGFKSHKSETAVMDFNGNLLSTPSTKLLKKCDACSDHCKYLFEQKSTGGQIPKTSRSYEVENVEKESCDKSPKVLIGSRSEFSNKRIKLCESKGNLTRICKEICPIDGNQCFTEVKIDACTCSGRNIKLREKAVYDMTTGELVKEVSGYSRVCGDCINFCRFRAGEENTYHVNDYITTCFNRKKSKKQEKTRS